jgi:hypothetical protein
MATENLDGIYSYPAAADLSGSQYQAVVVNSSGAAALAGANVSVDGLLHNLPKLGEMARVVHLQGVILKVRAGAAFAVGAYLTTNATGRLVTATTGQFVCAKAQRQAATANGDIVEVLWFGRGGGVAP